MANEDETADNFEYRGWQVRIAIDAIGPPFSGHADLWLNNVMKCRVVLSTHRSEASSARWALDSKARDYIDDWVTRPRTGTTGFVELGED
ncbi:MAG: hypothetical protein EOP20_01835 [Hyphomicrobiales bacterium]|nr:MAG: hypothetical protein EOP20_01835 [Hyphomicrobiales bacterium]